MAEIENETIIPTEKPEKVVQNSVTRPNGAKTGRVWAIADELSREKGEPATRAEVRTQGLAEGLSAGTLNTQYGQWCKFHGIETNLAVRKGLVAPKTKTAAEDENEDDDEK